MTDPSSFFTQRVFMFNFPDTAVENVQGGVRDQSTLKSNSLASTDSNFTSSCIGTIMSSTFCFQQHHLHASQRTLKDAGTWSTQVVFSCVTHVHCRIWERKALSRKTAQLHRFFKASLILDEGKWVWYTLFHASPSSTTQPEGPILRPSYSGMGQWNWELGQ